jgi:hypothetical protein
MKKSLLVIPVLLLLAIAVITPSCAKKKEVDPCDGIGTLNVENKLDSAITVKVTETHQTESIDKDYTYPFSLPGNQPYTLTIDGPQYHKDTTVMLLFCDNKLLIVTK